MEDAERLFAELSGRAIDEFWSKSQAESAGLIRQELASVLIRVGLKYNFGFAPAVSPMPDQIAAFWGDLHLEDLALAHACALGRDAAWQRFVTRFREPLTRAAIAMTGSADTGAELADSLYSEMYGLVEREGARQSPLSSYSGRGSLQGFLRATLAQRNVDHHRRAKREMPLTADIFAAKPNAPPAASETLTELSKALAQTLETLSAEERFLLSSWFLDQRTLLEISQVVGVHEATISRRIQRLTARLHSDLIAALESRGMSRAAAEETLGVDPRDLDVNLRNLLQPSGSDTFRKQEAQPAAAKPL